MEKGLPKKLDEEELKKLESDRRIRYRGYGADSQCFVILDEKHLYLHMKLGHYELLMSDFEKKRSTN